MKALLSFMPINTVAAESLVVYTCMYNVVKSKSNSHMYHDSACNEEWLVAGKLS